MDELRRIRLKTFRKLVSHFVLTIPVYKSTNKSYTDGKSIWLDKLDECIFQHEIMHILLEHVPRMIRINAHMNPVKQLAWNIAADMVVNDILNQLFGYKLDLTAPDDCKCVELLYKRILNDEKCPHCGKSLKELAKSIERDSCSNNQNCDDNQSNGKNIDDSGKSVNGQNENKDRNSQYDSNETASKCPLCENHDLRITDDSPHEPTYQAMREMAEKLIGKCKGTIMQELEFANARANFTKFLSDFHIQLERGFDDITFYKVSKFNLVNPSYPIRIPSWTKNTLHDPYILIDSSGSISDEEYSYFIGCIKNCKQLKDATVIIVDTDIQNIVKIKEFKLNALKKRKGYGGTDFTSAFEWLHKQHAKYVIVFTDMDLHFPSQPSFRVIWCTLPQFRQDVPYGHVCTIMV